jgi:hypothetical protein
MLLDIGKAYDTVPRNKMIHKMHNKYKISANICNMIGQLYIETSTITKIQDKMSKQIETTNGLLQGAITSPTLFNLYINELIEELNKQKEKVNVTHSIKLNNLCFADDIALISNNQQDLKKLYNVCIQKQKDLEIYFNEDKCIHIGEEPIEIIKTQENAKYLGVTINNKHKGIHKEALIQKQISETKTKTRYVTQFCEKYNLNYNTRINLYKCLVRPKMEYGAQFIKYTQNGINEIEETQKQCLTQILSLENKTEYKELLQLTGLQSMEERYKTLKIKFYYKTKKQPKKNILHRFIKESKQTEKGLINQTIKMMDNETRKITEKNKKEYEKYCEERTKDIDKTHQKIQTNIVTKEKEKRTKNIKQNNMLNSKVNIHFYEFANTNKEYKKYYTNKIYTDTTKKQAENTIFKLFNDCNKQGRNKCKYCNQRKRNVLIHQMIDCSQTTEIKKDMLSSIKIEIQNLIKKQRTKKQFNN